MVTFSYMIFWLCLVVLVELLLYLGFALWNKHFPLSPVTDDPGYSLHVILYGGIYFLLTGIVDRPHEAIVHGFIVPVLETVVRIVPGL